MEKMASDGPKWGQEEFFPTNPDLAGILGRTDLDFENLHFWDFLEPKFLDFQVPRSPNSQISRFPDFQTPPPAAEPLLRSARATLRTLKGQLDVIQKDGERVKPVHPLSDKVLEPLG